MPKITVAIPTSEMGGKGAEYLKHNFQILGEQTFTDFDVVVTDNSDNYDIAKVCEESFLKITYYRNPIKGMAQNTNEAIKRSKGDYIKILYLDDYLAHENALKNIVDSFEGHQWLVTACEHDVNGEIGNPHLAEYNSEMFLGKNTIGAPSVLTVKNKDPLLFDENLTWLLDCDLYTRYYDLYGPPAIVNVVNVVIRQHPEQMTNLIRDERKKWEYDYMVNKYTK